MCRPRRDAKRDRPDPLRGGRNRRRARADRRRCLRRGGSLHDQRTERGGCGAAARAPRRRARHGDRTRDPAARPRHAGVDPGREGALVIPLQAAIMGLVAVGSLAVVLTRDLVRLAMADRLYAFLLVVLFLVFQAPDVALSELVVGAVGFPLVIVVAIVMQRDRKSTRLN